jgi:kynurenine formamidase
MFKRIIISLLFFCQLSSVFCQVYITGKWVSHSPEKINPGYFAIRRFDFREHEWEVLYTLYKDSALKSPVFTFRAEGSYTIGKRSTVVTGAWEAVFGFKKKYLTLQTRDTALIKKFGIDRCNLVPFQEKDITATGCAYLASREVCGQEFDLVSLSGNILYLGARPQSGGMCDITRRPKSIGLPLVRTLTGGLSVKSKLLSQVQVNIVDLSHTLNEKFPFIPTSVTFPFGLRPIATIDNLGVAANEWKIHEHIGTQFDAPNHFIKGGMSAEQVDVRNLFVPAVVIDISQRAAEDRDAVMTVEDILKWEKQYGIIPPNAAILMYSGWDKKVSSPAFIGLDSSHKKHFPGISREAATFLVQERSIAGVGVDVISFDPGIDDTYETHRIILGKGKWALECLANLDKIPVSGTYIFVGSPKIEGATGGLSRVFAIW